MKIAAFNVKQLGWKKVNNPFVRENLIKIVSRYSVVVMLEVIDATGKAMDKFLVALNNHKDNVQHPYEMKCSEPLGRSSYKEKFVFFYRKDQVKMINSYQYEEEDDDEYEDEEEDDDEYEDEEDDNYEDDTEDEAVDVLAREPFILQFKSPTTAVKKLALIPVHTKPEDAKRELDAVDDVVKAVRKRWRTTNIMILGDFNADGHYVSEERLRGSRIASPPYHWLIGDDADTTTSNRNDYTYDRIVVFGQTMLRGVVPGSAMPFNFQRAFRLTVEEAQSISDHYPVEVELKPHTNTTSVPSRLLHLFLCSFLHTGTRGGSIRSRAHEETTSLFSVTPRISPAFLPSTQHIYHRPRLQPPAFIPRPSYRYTPYHFTPHRFFPLPSPLDFLSDLLSFSPGSP